MPQATNNPFTGNNVAEVQLLILAVILSMHSFSPFLSYCLYHLQVSSKDAFQKLSLDQFAAFSAPFDVVGDSFPSSAVPSVVGTPRFATLCQA